eukprot:tig00001234_g7737.t1
MPIPHIPLSDRELFGSVNGCLVAWFCLFFLPRAKITQIVVYVHAVFYSLLYTLVVIASLSKPGAVSNLADLNSFDGVHRLLASEDTTLAAWVHYVVFDVWIAKWISDDSSRRGISHFVVVPCFFLTMMQASRTDKKD